jgi:hypothetical protein
MPIAETLIGGYLLKKAADLAISSIKEKDNAIHGEYLPLVKKYLTCIKDHSKCVPNPDHHQYISFAKVLEDDEFTSGWINMPQALQEYLLAYCEALVSFNKIKINALNETIDLVKLVEVSDVKEGHRDHISAFELLTLEKCPNRPFHVTFYQESTVYSGFTCTPSSLNAIYQAGLDRNPIRIFLEERNLISQFATEARNLLISHIKI